MRLSFQKDILLNVINIVSKAVSSKSTMPILGCILIDANDGEIKLTANDTELGIETKVEGTILENGKIAVDAKLFYEIIRKLPSNDSNIIFDSDEKLNISINCESSIFHIQGHDGEEFSYLPYIEKNNYISISQFTLKEIIRQTIFSINPLDSNKMMGGELMEIKDDCLKLVSLDGHRISIRNISLKKHYEDISVIIPGKTLLEISRILSGDNEKEIYIYFSDNHVLFEFDETVVVSRLIEGNYFKIDHMISGDYETKVTLNRRELLDSIDRSMILISENDRKPIILNIEDHQINIKIKSSAGSMSGDIAAHKTGKDIMIAFNPRFLMEALRVIDDEMVDIYMMSPKSPCFIRDDQKSYIYLILPVSFNVE